LAIEMNGVINIKKRKMIFEKKSLCVVVPLDLQKDHARLNRYTIMKVMTIWTRFIR